MTALDWLLRFKPSNTVSDKIQKPGKIDTGTNQSDADELTIEWVTLTGQKMTALRVSQILEAAEQGSCQEQAALIQMMIDREPIIAAHLQTRMLAVLGCDWKIESETKDDKRTEEVEKLLKKAKIYDLMRHLLDAIPTGYAGSSIEWASGGGDIRGFKHVNPSNWLFDQGGNPGLYTMSGEKSLASYHPNQFVFHVHQMKPGIPSKGGLLRTLVWMWLFKKNAWRDRARFIEKFGIPFLVAKISRQDFDDEAQRNKIMTLLRRLGADGVSLITEDSEIDNVSPSGQSNNADFHQFCKDIDEVFALLILGQLATSGNQPGKLGNSTEQENVRLDILESDCKNLMETVNTQVLNPLERFKYGTEGELCFELEYEPGEDMQPKANLVKTLSDSGFKAKRDWVEKTFDIPIEDASTPTPPDLPPGSSGSPMPPVKPPRLPALMDFADSPSAKFANREEFVARLTGNTLGRLFKSPEAMAEFYRPLQSEIRRTFKDIDPDDPDLVEKFQGRLKAFFDKYPALYDVMDTGELEKNLQGAMLSSLVHGYSRVSL